MAAAPPMTPMEAFRSGAHWLKAGETVKAVHSLEYAAEKGHALAQWKLGRMYAEGDGVAQNDLKAFEYFRRIADGHADDNPDTPQARFVANAFVALGHYYLDGIPKTDDQARSGSRARDVRLCGVVFPRSRRAILSGAALSRRQRRAARPAPGRALVRAVRAEGPVRGAGHARRHAVRGRPRAAAGRARPDVAGARQGQRAHRSGVDHQAL